MRAVRSVAISTATSDPPAPNRRRADVVLSARRDGGRGVMSRLLGAAGPARADPLEGGRRLNSAAEIAMPKAGELY